MCWLVPVDKQLQGDEIVTGFLWAGLQGRHAIAAEAYCDVGMPERAVQMCAERGQAAEASALAAQLGLDFSRLFHNSSPVQSTQAGMSSLGSGPPGLDEVEAAADARVKASTSN